MGQNEEKPQKRRRGRPPGSSGVAQRAKNAALMCAEVKPLQVLLETMADRWNESKQTADPDERRKLQGEACQVAKDVAPYFHPKLQATTLKGEEAAPVAITLEFATSEELRKAVRGN